MPNLKLTKEHNSRTPEIWAAIEPNVELDERRVVDLGCGWGDLAFRCHLAGASYVLGIDRDPVMLYRRKEWEGVIRGFAFAEMNINALVAKNHKWDPPFDVAFCMSVLPYLRPRRSALKWIHKTVPVAVIESQYWGDGAGPAELRDQGDMRHLLEQIWDRVDVIGGSVVAGRGVRDIWRCIRD